MRNILAVSGFDNLSNITIAHFVLDSIAGKSPVLPVGRVNSALYSVATAACGGITDHSIAKKATKQRCLNKLLTPKLHYFAAKIISLLARAASKAGLSDKAFS